MTITLEQLPAMWSSTQAERSPTMWWGRWWWEWCRTVAPCQRTSRDLCPSTRTQRSSRRCGLDRCPAWPTWSDMLTPPTPGGSHHSPLWCLHNRLAKLQYNNQQRYTVKLWRNVSWVRHHFTQVVMVPKPRSHD